MPRPPACWSGPQRHHGANQQRLPRRPAPSKAGAARAGAAQAAAPQPVTGAWRVQDSEQSSRGGAQEQPPLRCLLLPQRWPALPHASSPLLLPSALTPCRAAAHATHLALLAVRLLAHAHVRVGPEARLAEDGRLGGLAARRCGALLVHEAVRHGGAWVGEVLVRVPVEWSGELRSAARRELGGRRRSSVRLARRAAHRPEGSGLPAYLVCAPPRRT